MFPPSSHLKTKTDAINIRFQKLNMFPSSGEKRETPILLSYVISTQYSFIIHTACNTQLVPLDLHDKFRDLRFKYDIIIITKKRTWWWPTSAEACVPNRRTPPAGNSVVDRNTINVISVPNTVKICAIRAYMNYDRPKSCGHQSLTQEQSSILRQYQDPLLTLICTRLVYIQNKGFTILDLAAGNDPDESLLATYGRLGEARSSRSKSSPPTHTHTHKTVKAFMVKPHALSSLNCVCR
jgi:hypothetical protein